MINVAGLDLDTHRDKRLPREEGLYKALPQTSMRSIPMSVAIDTINIASSYVSHSEFSENGELPGIIFFKRHQWLSDQLHQRSGQNWQS